MAIKASDNHVQCRPQRVNGVVTTSWIPQKYAKKGKYLKLKNDDGEWENGWQVIDTFGVRPTADIMERSQDYKHQREASDV